MGWKTKNLGLVIGLILVGTQSFGSGDNPRPRIPNPVGALPARTDKNWGDPAILPGDVLDYMNSFLNPRAFGALACTNTTYDAYSRSVRGDRVEAKIFKREFLGNFVTIPAGFLPPDATGHQAKVESFQSLKHPVTREMWDYFLKGTPEYNTWWNTHVPDDIKHDWNQRRNVPVTFVAWEENEEKNFAPAEAQFFFTRLNQWAKKNDPGCHYRASTDHENQYKRRADVTGLNQDEFSTGITRANVNEYITHAGNSDPYGHDHRVLHPIGLKEPNEFGIELGNVWEISSDLYDPADPEYGRAIRGGSWNCAVSSAGSAEAELADVGVRAHDHGLSVVRTCP